MQRNRNQKKEERKNRIGRHGRSVKSKSISVAVVIGSTPIDNNTVPEQLMMKTKRKKQINTITSLRNELTYSKIIVEKAKDEREELLSLRKKVKSLNTSLRKVEETANSKVMIAAAASSQYLDQVKNLRLRYTDVTASRKQAFNKERDKLKQQHQKEVKLWSKKVSQVKSNE